MKEMVVIVDEKDEFEHVLQTIPVNTTAKVS